MDNLQTLFDKKQYELILSVTKGSSDPHDLFLRLSSFICLGKSDDALDLIDKNRDILEKTYQLQLMKLHFELLLSKKLYDEAKINLCHYESLPYVSQEVEEFMRDMKVRIEEEEHPNNHPVMKNIDEIQDILEKSNDNKEISSVIFNLKNYNINLLLESLKIFMKRDDVHPNFRTYVLILLVDNQINCELEILTLNGLLKVNPTKIEPPFMSKNFNDVCRLITEASEKNMSIRDTALHLFNCYIIDTYPIEIYDISLDDLAGSFVYIAKKYLGQEISSLDENFEELSKKIQSIIESTPELKL